MYWISIIGLHLMRYSKRSVLLSLSLSLVAFPGSIPASDGIESMRLFYSAEERIQKNADTDVREGLRTDTGPGASNADALHTAEENEANLGEEGVSASKSHLVFNALVILGDRSVAVINDLPCHIEHDNTSSKHLAVLCAQNDLSAYTLFVSAVTGHLDIYQGVGKLASLAVGEKL